MRTDRASGELQAIGIDNSGIWKSVPTCGGGRTSPYPLGIRHGVAVHKLRAARITKKQDIVARHVYEARCGLHYLRQGKISTDSACVPSKALIAMKGRIVEERGHKRQPPMFCQWPQ